MPGEHAVVKQRRAAGDTVSMQPFLLQPFEKLPEGDVAVYGPAVPHRPAHVPVLDRLGRDRLGHGKERER